MAYKKYKRRTYRGRRRKRRKLSIGKRMKRVVRQEFKKRIEMKRVTGTSSMAEVASAGTLIDLLAAGDIPQGDAQGQRTGNKINMHRLQTVMHLQGPAGQTDPVVVRARVVFAYAKQACILADFPGGIDTFWNLAAMKANGIYKISDRTYTLAPCCATVVNTGQTNVYWSAWAASHPSRRTIKKQFNFKGRAREWDDAAAVTKGFWYLYVFSETNADADRCDFAITDRWFFTDP